VDTDIIMHLRREEETTIKHIIILLQRTMDSIILLGMDHTIMQLLRQIRPMSCLLHPPSLQLGTSLKDTIILDQGLLNLNCLPK
jgi:hypothetical protein